MPANIVATKRSLLRVFMVQFGYRDFRLSLVIRSEAEQTGTAMQRFGGILAGVGQEPGVESGIAVVGHRFRAVQVGAQRPSARGDITGLLRRVPAIAEVVVRGAVCGRPIVWGNVCPVAAEMAADPV